MPPIRFRFAIRPNSHVKVSHYIAKLALYAHSHDLPDVDFDTAFHSVLPAVAFVTLHVEDTLNSYLLVRDLFTYQVHPEPVVPIPHCDDRAFRGRTMVYDVPGEQEDAKLILSGIAIRSIDGATAAVYGTTQADIKLLQ